MIEFCASPECLNEALEDIRCEVCGWAYYCCSLHKSTDLTHRSRCRTSRTPFLLPSTLDNARMLSVLFFPEDEDLPRIIQTEYRAVDNDNVQKEAHRIDIGALLQVPFAERSLHFPIGGIEPSEPPTRLYLALLPDPHVNAQRNRAVARLMGGLNDYPLPLMGNILGYRAREPATDWTQFADVSPADIPAFSAFLRARELPTFAFTWRWSLQSPLGFMDVHQTTSRSADLVGSMTTFNSLAHTQERHRSVRVQTESQLAPDGHNPAIGLTGGFHAQVSQVDFEQQKAAIRAIVAEESLRATLFAFVVAAAARTTWAYIVLPTLALFWRPFSAVDVTVGASASALVVGIGSLVWHACQWRSSATSHEARWLFGYAADLYAD
ncbi:hypothetical protein GY45DRAFT_812207 [Cubamyces sp. BRFM 1775]|nr:hypothetical protein GY45DRAFT_812207 [Cubamyces sp. BRFM 1775]